MSSISPTEEPPPDPRISRWNGQFLDPGLERAYLAQTMERNADDARLGLILSAGLILLFFYPDYLYVASGSALLVVAGMRTITAASGLAAAIALKRQPRLVISGWTVTAAECFTLGAYGGLVWCRTEALSWLFAMLMIMIMGVFILIPNRLWLMVGAAAVGVTSMLVQTAVAAPLTMGDFLVLAMVLVLPGVLGFVAARRFEISRRVEFLRTHEQRRVVERLESEVRHREALEEKFRELAQTDTLTGLPNRRRFELQADSEMERARRSGLPLSLAVFDADRFKQINDTYGHAGGDAALVSMASVGSAQVRNADLLARIGGEEFALLLPDTEAAEAANLCERLRAAIARETITHDQDSFNVTATFGVAQWHAESSEPLADLLRRADRALYQGKRAGRDQVMLAVVD